MLLLLCNHGATAVGPEQPVAFGPLARWQELGVVIYRQPRPATWHDPSEDHG